MVDYELANIDTNGGEAALDLLLLAGRNRFGARLLRLQLGREVAHTHNVLHLLHHGLGLPCAAKKLKGVVLLSLLGYLI